MITLHCSCFAIFFDDRPEIWGGAWNIGYHGRWRRDNIHCNVTIAVAWLRWLISGVSRI